MDDILDILVAHGVPGTTIVRVAKLIAESQANESRKTKNRERMQTVRARARTQVHTETQETAPIGSKKESKKEGSIGRGRASRAKPQTPLPDNWHPELAGNVEFERFCDHARSKGRLCADWDAALRNWNRNAPRFNGAQGNGNGRRSGSVLDAFDRLGEKLKAAGASDDYVPGSSGPRPLKLDTQVRPNGLKLIPKG
jgi:hypothetical protein